MLILGSHRCGSTCLHNPMGTLWGWLRPLESSFMENWRRWKQYKRNFLSLHSIIPSTIIWSQFLASLTQLNTQQDSRSFQSVPSAGEAVSLAQDVVKTMAAKGYILGKDALGKAKAFDESHQVSATAVAKVAELSERFGLTDKIFAGVEAARIVNQRYHISDTTRSAVSATGRTAASAASAVVNSGYFSQGALWVSGALGRAAQAAADLGSRGVNKWRIFAL